MKTFILLLALTTPALAWDNSQQGFDSGYEQGYQAIRGDMVIVPITPIAPIAPIGSTDFQQGILQGIEDAQEDSGDYRDRGEW